MLQRLEGVVLYDLARKGQRVNHIVQGGWVDKPGKPRQKEKERKEEGEQKMVSSDQMGILKCHNS